MTTELEVDESRVRTATPLSKAPDGRVDERRERKLAVSVFPSMIPVTIPLIPVELSVVMVKTAMMLPEAKETTSTLEETTLIIFEAAPSMASVSTGLITVRLEVSQV